MEQNSTEKLFSLEEVEYTRLWGTNERILDFVRMLFPKLKLILRGDQLKVIGNADEIAFFEGKFQAMLTYYEKFGRLTENAIMQIMESGGTFAEAETNDEILVHGRNGLLVKPRTPNQKRLVEAIQNNDMVFAIGPAGSGKTYTAVAMAVRALKNKQVRRIILTRPAVEAGENLGFLPGDLRDKLDPYLQPLYDALRDMIPQQKLLSYWEDNTIEIAPLAFMRGRTLDNAFVILDEAQNATSMQLKMFLTRMGRNAKFVVTGDITQIDLPRHQQSGLVQATQLLNGIEGIEVIQLEKSDVVRHKLVTQIIAAYDDTEPSPVRSEQRSSLLRGRYQSRPEPNIHDIAAEGAKPLQEDANEPAQESIIKGNNTVSNSNTKSETPINEVIHTGVKKEPTPNTEGDMVSLSKLKEFLTELIDKAIQ